MLALMSYVNAEGDKPAGASPLNINLSHKQKQQNPFPEKFFVFKKEHVPLASPRLPSKNTKKANLWILDTQNM